MIIKAPNFFPSVSQALAFDKFTSILWLVCIWLHLPLRLIILNRLIESFRRIFAFLYKPELATPAALDSESEELLAELDHARKNTKFEYSIIKYLILAACCANLIEMVGLLLLATFSTRMDNDTHTIGSAVYSLFSIQFVFYVCLLERKLFIANIVKPYKTNTSALSLICLLRLNFCFYFSNIK